MKLHLPKLLLTAVLAAVSLNLTAYGAQGWADENGNGDYYKSASVFYVVSDDNGDVDATERRDNIYIRHDQAENTAITANIGTLSIKDGQHVLMETSRWGSGRTFEKLTIDEISTTGAFTLETTGSSNTFVIKSIAGTVTSLNNAASLTIGTSADGETSASTTTFSGAITNSGTLTINGTIAFNVDENSGFEVVGGGETTYTYDSEKEEGFKSVAGAQYELIGENTGTISITEQDGLTIARDDATGNVTSVIFSAAGYTGDTFRINGSDINEATLIADTTNTGVTATTKYDLVAGTLTVAGDISTDRLSYSGGSLVLGSNTLTIADGNTQLLLNTTGTGNVILTANLALARQQASQASGKLTICNGAQLTLGDSDLNSDNTGAVGASIASFTAVELDKGTIYVNNPNGTIKNLSVTANGGTINVYDLDGELLLDETTTLNGNLNLSHTYNTQIAVTKLAGTGNLVVNKGSDSFELAINGKDAGYSGEVQVQGTNASNLTLSTAQDLGLNVRVSTTSGEIDLGGIGSGNTVILYGAVGGIKSGTVAANVKLENTYSKAGMEVTDAADTNSVEYAGEVSGSGNYLIGATKTVEEQSVNVTTNTTFSGKTSGYTGQLRILRGEHNVTYTGSATAINNSWIVDDGATANVTLDHAAAATVSKAMTPTGTLNLTVKNSSEAGTKLAAGATINKLTVGDNTTLALGGATSAATAELGKDATLLFDGGTLTVSSSLTLDASAIKISESLTTTADTKTLLEVTGEGNALTVNNVGSWTGSGTYTIDGKQYTTSLSQTGNVLELTFSELLKLEAPVTGFVGLDGTMLTLSVEANLANYSSVLITGISDDIMKQILGLEGLPEDGMVNITLKGTENSIFKGGVDGALEFQGNTGVYTGNVNVGSATEYNVAYIPEPTTATLSLLALMGLAARRRRK